MKKPICDYGGVFKFKTKDGLRYNIGTANKNDCKAVYLTMTGWITADMDLDRVIDAFKRRLRMRQPQLSTDYFGSSVSRYMTDYDYSKTKLHAKAGKTSFMTIEITLMSSSRFDWKDNDFQVKLKEYAERIYRELVEIDIDFILTDKSK